MALLLALTFGSAHGATNCVAVPPGVVAWWTGDVDGRDQTGNHGGVLKNGALIAVGKVGGAFALDGVDDYVEVPDDPSWAFGTSDFTVELWAKHHAMDRSMTLLSSDNGSGTQLKWILGAGSGLGLHVVSDTTGVHDVAGGPLSPALDEWQHFALVRRGDNLRFFTNGVLFATVTNQVDFPDCTVPLTIGMAENGFWFDGLLDEITVYNRALDDGEILSIYDADSYGKSTGLRITVQPASVVAPAGASVLLSVTAAGTGLLGYQWYQDGTNLLVGATGSQLTVSNIQQSLRYRYQVVVTNIEGAVTSQVARISVDTELLRVSTGTLGTLSGEILGAAWGDYDEDQQPDLFVTYGWPNAQPSALYRNGGGGQFSAVQGGPWLTEAGHAFHPVWADADGDGLLDVYVARYNNERNLLFRNLGGGAFSNLVEGPLVQDAQRSTMAAWVDMDRDGDLDLVVVNDDYQSARLYRNGGNLRFSDVAAMSGFGGSGLSQAVAWVDCDDNGYPDLYVGNNPNNHNFLFMNAGNGSFVEKSGDPVDALVGGYNSFAFADYDNDGDLDLVAADYGSHPRFFRNRGGGDYEDITRGPFPVVSASVLGVSWADYDNDGWLDLFLACRGGADNQLYHNEGDGTFRRVMSGAVVNDGGESRSGAWADFDRDGFVDLFVVNTGEPCFLYSNQGNSNSWLTVRCRRSASGADVIGAKVRAHARIDGQLVWQRRDVGMGEGASSRGELLAHFGLGDATNVTELRIEWPSGAVQTLTNVPPRQFLTVYEQSDTVPVIAVQPLEQVKVYWGSNVLISVSAVGAPPLLCLWYQGTNLLSAGTNSNLTLPAADWHQGGDYRLVVSNVYGMATSRVAQVQVDWPVVLERSTNWPMDGLDSRGAAFADYDGDGWLDLCVVGHGENQLYRNLRNGSFARVLDTPITAASAPHQGVAWGDADADGDFDVCIAMSGGASLYRNLGGAEFEKVGAFPLADVGGSWLQPVWGDFEGRGRLGLFVCGPGVGNALLRNDGDLRFRRVAGGQAGLDRATSRGAAWADLDQDGDLDLYVVNDGSENDFAYWNDGEGNLIRMIVGALGNDGSPGAGMSCADFDNDGDLDLLVSQWYAPNRLYRNDGAGLFTVASAGPLTTGAFGSGALAWGDCDNDGDLDVFIGSADAGGDVLYLNAGSGQFVEAEARILPEHRGYSSGASWGDVDGDGDLDLYVANRAGEHDVFYRNAGNGASWLEVELRRASGERGGIGTKVWARAVICGESLSQMREVGADVSSVGQGAAPLHFGLGDATNVAELRIEWPSGAVQTLTNVAPRQFLTVYEQSDTVPVISVQPLEQVNVLAGTNATIAVSVVGQEPLTWFWYQNGTNQVRVGTSTNASLVLTNVGLPQDGAYTLVLSNSYGMVTSRVARVVVEQQVFTLAREIPGPAVGAAWGDYDGDGDQDLYIGLTSAEPNLLFRNDGNGTLTGVPGSAVAIGGATRSACWADYDNDGDLDLFVAVDGAPSVLFENVEGTLQPAGFAEGGLGMGSARGSGWADADRDGHLDLYVAQDYGEGNLWFHNQGGGRLVRQIRPPLTDGNASHAVVWMDYDGDWRPDLFVSNSGDHVNWLLHNEGELEFTRNVAAPWGTDTGYHTSGAWGDVDNDGILDVLIPNDGNPRFYRGVSAGLFERVTSGFSFPPQQRPSCAAWGDLDNDGDLDLVLGSGAGGRNAVFRNDGGFQFVSLTGGGFGLDDNLHGVSLADFDRDGDLDLLALRGDAGLNRLYRNDGGSNAWLELRCLTPVGDGGLRDAIGAKVSVTAQIGGQWVCQHRDVRSSSDGGYGCAAPLELHFGLGDATQASGVEVVWPSGWVQTLTNVTARQLLTVVEERLEPWVTVHPSSAVALAAGGDHVLSVTALGQGPLSYQWRWNGMALAGQTNASLTFSNATLAQSGAYSVVVSNASGAVTSQVSQVTVEWQAAFDRVDGWPTDGMSSYAAAWGDFDGNGWPDLFVTSSDVGNRLYRNRGDGTFTNVTVSGLTTTQGGHVGAAWGDVDNDGDLDLVVTKDDARGNQLWLNEGGGAFVPAPRGPQTSIAATSRQPVWGDYDRDGFLDLFVSNLGQNNLLYRNARGSVFAPVLDGPLVTGGGNSAGAAWADANGDGWLDLFVVNGNTERDFLYLGQPGGSSLQQLTGSVVNDPTSSAGCAWADYDNDGDLDLFIAEVPGPRRLYRNDGNQTFIEVSASWSAESASAPFSPAWGDYDNDGDLDLFLTSWYGQPDLLYRNEGQDRFSRVLMEAPAVRYPDTTHHMSAGWADADRDGDLDLYVCSWAGRSDLYFRNRGSGGAWLQVNLVCASGQRGGVGTVVRALAMINGQAVWQMRQVGSDVGYLSQSALPVHFGFGDATNVAALRIEWPSGAVQTLTNVAPRQFLTVHEQSDGPPAISVQPLETISAVAGSNLVIQTSVVGQSPLAYFWYRNGTNLVSAGTNASLVLTNVGWQQDGLYTLVVSNSFGAVTSRLAQVTVRWQTEFVRDPAWPKDGTYTYAPAFADYDGDGWLDLCVSHAGDGRGNLLYHNLGNGSFAEVTNTPISAAVGNSGNFGLAWADFDNDGDLDLFGTRSALGGNHLFVNEGNGTFLVVTNSPPTLGPSSDWQQPVWGDFDNDGRLDLFVATIRGTNALYRGDAGGSLVKVTTGPVANDPAPWSAAGAWGDYTGDGWLDLFVANGRGGPGLDYLYRNDGGGGFSRITSGPAVEYVSDSLGVSWGDYDNDGDLDLIMVPYDLPARLYRNDGSVFTVASAGLLTQESHAHDSASWGDFDNDGDLDIFLSARDGNRLYRNDGNGTFAKVTSVGPGTDVGQSASAMWGDVDRDGDLDLYVANIYGEDDFFYRNAGNSAAWLELELVRASGQRGGIGTVVRALATINGQAVWQMRQVGSDVSFVAQGAAPVHFGLGDATNVARLRIEWPSGRVSEFENVAPRQFLTVKEGTEIHVVQQGRGEVSYSPMKQDYLVGEPITLSATPGRYYRFLQWNDGNTNAVRTVPVGLTNVYTALFTNTVPLELHVLREWERVYGGTGEDWLSTMQLTPDGGYIIGGYSASGISGNKDSNNWSDPGTPNDGDFDYWVIKLDSEGNKEWENSYGSPGVDYLIRIILLREGGYLLVGDGGAGAGGNKTEPGYGGGDIWMIRLDAQGTRLWDRLLGGSAADNAYHAIQTSDGGFLVVGNSWSPPSGTKTSPYMNHGGWIVKTDENGISQWDHTFGLDTGYDDAFQVAETASGYWVFGAGGVPDQSVWALKLSFHGTQLGAWTYEGSSFAHPGADPVPLPDGGFVIPATGTGAGGSDWRILCIDAAGNPSADYYFGGSGADILVGLIALREGGYLGYSHSGSPVSGDRTAPWYGGGYDGWLMRLDEQFQPRWDLSLGGDADDYAYVVRQTADEGFLVSGASLSGISGNKTTPSFGSADCWLVKLSNIEVPVGTPVVLVNGWFRADNAHALTSTNAIAVTIESSFANGQIYYTLDGSDPIFATPYTGPIAISNSVVVRAMAFNESQTAYPECDPVTVSVVPVFELAATAAGGGSVSASPSGGMYLSNTVVTLTAVAADGWTFLHWSGDAAGSDPEVSVTMEGEKRVEAVFGTALGTVVVPVGYGTIEPEPDLALYPYGSVVRLNAEGAAGKYLVQWSGAVGSVSNSPVELVVTNANPSVSALFGTLPVGQYALTVRIDGGAGNTVLRSPHQAYYASGTPVTLTAVPAAGEQFWGWTGDAAGDQAQVEVVMLGNRLVTAQFGAAPPVPANDLFADRIGLSGYDLLATGRNAWATKEPGEPNHGGPGGKSIWWDWVSPATGPAVVSTIGSDFDTILGVYTGTAVNALTVVGVDDDGNGDQTSRVSYQAAAGVHYLIAVDGAGLPAAEGNVRLTVGVNTPPAVSLTSPMDGAVLALPGSVTLLAEASDPGGAVVRVEFLINGAVVVEDASAPYTYSWVNPPVGVYGIQARAVDDWGASSTSGGVTLTVRVPNDAFADCLVMSGTPVQRTGTTAGATVEPGEPTPTSQSAAQHSVWYAWTAPHNGGAVLEVVGQGFDPVVAVYAFAAGETNLTVNRLEQVGNALDGPNVRLSFPIAQGTTYYVTVDGKDGGVGLFDLTLASSQLPTVSIVSPTTGAAYASPAEVRVTANAIDLDGTISRVEVLVDGVSAGLATGKPPAMTNYLSVRKAYSLAAVATDNLGFSSTSAPVVIVVRGPTNQPPTVTWQQPAAGTEFSPGDPIPMWVTASDPDGLLARVEFYGDSAWLGTAFAEPYQAVWRGAGQGAHTLRVVAVDLEGARTTNSIGINVTVIVPENDAFADRALLSGARATGLGNSAGASWESGEPAHAGVLPSHSVWWGWTSPGVGRLSVDTAGSDLDTVLAVYTGSTVSQLTERGSDNNSGANGTSRLSLMVSNGMTLAIAVDGVSGASGAVVLNVAFDQAPVIELTSPEHGAGYVAPADILLAALASDAEGPVARVDFFRDSVLVRSLTNAPFEHTVSGVSTGSYGFRAVAVDGAGLSVTSAPATVVVSAAVLNQPVFRLGSATYSVGEGDGQVVVRVEKSTNSTAAVVNYTTANGTARAVSAGVGDYQATSGSLDFAAGETFKQVSIPIVDDLAYEGEQSFSLVLGSPTGGGVLGTPSAATIRIIDNDLPASTNSLIDVVFPADAPMADNALRVMLEPAAAGGQWRLRWETTWRASGSLKSGLVAGNYELEFRPVSGYLPPGNVTVPVAGGQLVTVTNTYALMLVPAVGSLRVELAPSGLAGAVNEVERAQWRLQGESFWRNSGEVVTGLAAGDQVIEFKGVNGYATPRARVVNVGPNQLNEVAVTYLLTASAPGTGPSVLPDHASLVAESWEVYPYAYTGQLLTDAGYGTGFVVKRRVVLTAAHVVFNDAALQFVNQVWWFFQRHKDDFEPVPQTPRGWYVFEGYAAQRAADNSPGVSSPASQQLDVAALYFLEDAGRGGQGGYLMSDVTPNEWLDSGAQKLLVGYPVEVVPEEDRGRMHRVAPMNYGFEWVAGQVYRTTGLKSYGGNSGGPLCVEYANGRYYPAAVYLGGTGQTIVRAIDSGVVDLINRAEVTANTGDNQVGPGPVPIPVPPLPPWMGGYLQVVIKPEEAFAAGAGWQLMGVGMTNYLSENGPPFGLSPATYTVEFHGATGFATPTNRLVTVEREQTTTIAVEYLPVVVEAPLLGNVGLVSGGQQFRLEVIGQEGAAYVVETKTNLMQPSWTAVVTNVAGLDGRWAFTNVGSSGDQARYYRVRVVQ